MVYKVVNQHAKREVAMDRIPMCYDDVNGGDYHGVSHCDKLKKIKMAQFKNI